jgi:hypothetical protein
VSALQRTCRCRGLALESLLSLPMAVVHRWALTYTVSLVDMIGRLMYTLNNSVFSSPHRVALQVLVNTVKCPASSHAIVAAAEVVDVLMDMLQMFRDNMTLFAPALHLLDQVSRDSARAASMAAKPDVLSRLASLTMILSRKTRISTSAPGAESLDDVVALLTGLSNRLSAHH